MSRVKSYARPTTVEEVATLILAEVIAHHRGGDGGPLRDGGSH